MFRLATRGKLLWVAQLRELASAADGGPHLFREAYERQLLLDPESLNAVDGSWAPEPMPARTPAAQGGEQHQQAFLRPLSVIRYDGHVACVSVDANRNTIQEAITASSELLGPPAFDPCLHVFFCVGAPPKTAVLVGHYVKLTGLVSGENLNGQIGVVTAVENDMFNVALSTATITAHCDNVIWWNVTAVTRHSAFEVQPNAMIGDWCLQDGARILWLERSVPIPTSANTMALIGPLKQIKSQLVYLAARGNITISVGELRSFLWNLRLSDGDFERVQERFASQSNYLQPDDVMFLLGRAHVQFPGVPVDAIIYEAVVSILGRRTTAHIDRDLGGEAEGLGYCSACGQHCASYTISLILQGIVVACLIILLLSFVLEVQIMHMNPETIQGLAIACGVSYILYLCHLCCCVGLTSAFANLTEGMEQVMLLMDKPRQENPYFRWHISCYHWVTRTEHYTDSDGKSRTRTHQEKMVTHTASASGVLPSTDLTSSFVPNTRAKQTQIDTNLQLDLSSSNYLSEYQRWCNFHRWDVHQDCTRSEDLHSRAASCIAVWTQRPWWMRMRFYWLANICLLSFFYRIYLQAHMGRQSYTYVKRCYSIPPQSPTGLVAGAALGISIALAAGAGGRPAAMAAAALMSVGVGAALAQEQMQQTQHAQQQQLQWQRLEQERLQFQQQELQKTHLRLQEQQAQAARLQFENARMAEMQQSMSNGKGAVSQTYSYGKGSDAQAYDAGGYGKGAASQAYDAGTYGKVAASQVYDAGGYGKGSASQAFDAGSYGKGAASQGYDTGGCGKGIVLQTYGDAGKGVSDAAKGLGKGF